MNGRFAQGAGARGPLFERVMTDPLLPFPLGSDFCLLFRGAMRLVLVGLSPLVVAVRR
jgi:hypothetical protein